MEDLGIKRLFGGIYKGKTVLITGHTGFKGSWLALWLTQLGARVVGYSLSVPTNPSHFKLLDLKIRSIKGDIRNRTRVEKAVRSCSPDIVFHLAAQPLVLRSYANPHETFETNVVGTVNVLEACRKSPGVKAVIVVTSDKCYENRETREAYSEGDRLGGRDPYSASKACAELVTSVYQKLFFADAGRKKSPVLAASVRAGNVIGGGDWADDRLFPDIMKAVSKKKNVEIRSPESIRPWQHVLEPISGYLAVGQKLLGKKRQFASAWNFSPSKPSHLKVIALLGLIKKEWPEIKYSVGKKKPRHHEARQLHLSSRKACAELDWKPVWEVSDAVRRTAQWYKAFYRSGKVSSLRDLDDYVSLARRARPGWVF